MPEQNYNQLVLAQLQSLSQAMEALRGDLQFVRQEITELKGDIKKFTTRTVIKSLKDKFYV